MSSSKVTNIEDILNTIENAGTDIVSQTTLASYLKGKCAASAFTGLILVGEDPATQEKRDPLDVLAMQEGKHTLGYLYFLSSRLYVSNSEAVTDEQIMLFADSFDPAIAELAPERMTILARSIWKKADSLYQPQTAVPPLRTILQKYPPPLPGAEDESRLTPTHPIFLQACFAASCPDQALHLLRRPITSVHAPSAPEPSSGNSAASSSRSDDYKLTYLDHLTYTYLAGVILCLLCLWQEADGYLEMCATAPTHGLALSALQLEAAKKLILVQLIAYGKVRPLPSYAPSALAKMLKQSPYLFLPKHYPSPPDNFPTQGDRKTFSQDNNMGLVSIALEKSVRWRIIEMMNTYEVLSLYEVCIQVGLTQEGGKQKLREVLLSMIEEGEIKASLEIENGEEIVSFNNTSTFSLGGSRVMPSGRDIQALVHATQREVKRLAKIERDMLLSKEFLTKALKPNQSDMYDDPEMSMGLSGGPGWDDIHL